MLLIGPNFNSTSVAITQKSNNQQTGTRVSGTETGTRSEH